MTSRAYCWTKFVDPNEFAHTIEDPEEARLLATIDAFEQLPGLLNHDPHRFTIAQVEIAPDTGAPHIQGYSEFKQPLRWSSLQRSFACFENVHGEARRGSREAARDYCSKEESRVHGPISIGEWEAGGQGKRSDLREYVAAVAAGLSDAELAEQFPTTHFLHGNKAAAFRRSCSKRPRDEEFVPREWQKQLIDRVSGPADDRSIVWVLDSRGGKGKSRLARHLYCEHGATVLTGKTADMSYLYQGERIVIFDITRAAAEHSKNLYSMAEAIKNRLVVSTKYESCIKACEHNVHVIFFANQRPEEGMWSEDRVTLIDLDM